VAASIPRGYLLNKLRNVRCLLLLLLRAGQSAAALQTFVPCLPTSRLFAIRHIPFSLPQVVSPSFRPSVPYISTCNQSCKAARLVLKQTVLKSASRSPQSVTITILRSKTFATPFGFPPFSCFPILIIAHYTAVFITIRNEIETNT
jgi:hypothetical protein